MFIFRHVCNWTKVKVPEFIQKKLSIWTFGNESFEMHFSAYLFNSIKNVDVKPLALR